MSKIDFEDDPFFLVRPNGIFKPAPLRPGDKIAIVSPASAVKEEYVYGAMARMEERGYEPVLMKYALGHVSGTFAASKGDRLMDMFEALEESDFKAIFCTRGGYGCTQLLQHFSPGMITKNPKWLIGFSDISALHALWYRSGMASIHGPMAKHLATKPADDPCTEALFNVLENGGTFDYIFDPHPLNKKGSARGVLRGGNLATLNDLAGTSYDILDTNNEKTDVILFLEDINEPIYKVNRMLYRLLHSDTFFNLKGIIFGSFTDYKPDLNFATMEDMISDFFQRGGFIPPIPICFKFPTGHTDMNYALVEGATVELEITDKKVRLHTV